MNIALIILVSLCLAQDATSSVVQVAINAGLATVASVAGPVTTAINNANTLLHQFSDNSTDYASAFNVNVAQEITNSMNTINQAFSNASSTVAASNASVSACLTAEQNQTQALAVNVVTEIAKCAVTKVRQFVDLAIHLTELANTTAYLVPNTNDKIVNCSYEGNDLLRIGCVGWQVAGATIKLVQISFDVSTTIATGTALYGTIQADLVLCAEAKLFSFRQVALKIPLTIGICLGQTAIASG